MGTRYSKWLLIPTGNNQFDVLRNGRRVVSDIDHDRAVRYLLRHSKRGDVFLREEADGYRVRLSPDALRRGKE